MGAMMSRFPFSSFRIPRRIEHDGITLRPLRIADVPFIRKSLTGTDAAGTGPGRTLSLSCLGVWWWLKKTYPIFFCIEVASQCVGFIGLYNLKGDSGEVTLVICHPADRRLGYASRAYHALAASLSRSLLFKTLLVRVAVDNMPSLAFWEKIGFDRLNGADGIRTMASDIGLVHNHH
jgi:ribosomal protein S18 acetylase RimI-like enzyme